MQLKSRFGTSYYLSWRLDGVAAEAAGLLAPTLAVSLPRTFVLIVAFGIAPIRRPCVQAGRSCGCHLK